MKTEKILAEAFFDENGKHIPWLTAGQIMQNIFSPFRKKGSYYQINGNAAYYITKDGIIKGLSVNNQNRVITAEPIDVDPKTLTDAATGFAKYINEKIRNLPLEDRNLCPQSIEKLKKLIAQLPIGTSFEIGDDICVSGKNGVYYPNKNAYFIYDKNWQYVACLTNPDTTDLSKITTAEKMIVGDTKYENVRFKNGYPIEAQKVIFHKYATTTIMQKVRFQPNSFQHDEKSYAKCFYYNTADNLKKMHVKNGIYDLVYSFKNGFIKKITNLTNILI